jgi:Big-like domain-containing protein
MMTGTFRSIGSRILAPGVFLTVAACEQPAPAPPVPVSSVDVNPPSARVSLGQIILLTATPKDAAGNPLTGRTVTWATTDAQVATVIGGLVTAVGGGSATITATSEGENGSAALTVFLPVASVDVTPASANVAVGKSIQLRATPKDFAGQPLSGRTVTWTSSDPGLAGVRPDGLVAGLAAGPATITAMSEGKGGAATIRVLTAPGVSCLTQPGPIITLNGVRPSAYGNTSVADNTKIDASDAQFLTAANVPIRVGGGSNTCFHGGEAIGQLPPSTDWNTMHDTYAFEVRGIPNFSLEGIKAFDYGDGITLDNNSTNWSIRGVHFKYIRDDCVQNDYVNSGTIEDSFFDGCYAGFSARPFTITPDGSNNLVVVRNSLFRLQDMDQGFSRPGHGGFFKWDSTGPMVAVYNSVFRLDNPPTQLDHSLVPPLDKLWACANNFMIWLGSGPFPEALPPCYTLLIRQEGIDFWDNAVAQWKANHPSALRDIGPPIVSLYAPSAGVTLTGTVSLTATAVDDQAVAGVRFQLDGQDIEPEATTESPATKFTLVWNSRSVPNGPYLLTATARDTSGNSATSDAIAITISNP